jgi:sugar/nucleoside kinase (ribokinase family)
MVVVGAASRDITGDDPRGWRLGGPATYCSLTAARLGLRVGCLLGVDDLAAEAGELAMLESAGVSLRLVRLEHAPVFENIEAGGHRRQRWLSASDPIRAAELPQEWQVPSGWLFAPNAGELGEDWTEAIPEGASVGLGWQGLLREFPEDGWVRRVAPRPSGLAASAGLVVASMDDMDGRTQVGLLRAAAPAAVVVLTAGEGGGVALSGGRLRRYFALAAPAIVDPTGAGDVFLAALMTAWLLTGEPATAGAMRFAAAAASCSVEGIGLAGVPTGEQVRERLAP